MRAKPDASVRTLVSETGLDRTLFVQAGAGTGKTTQLVERIANLVLGCGARLESIAAITFTEAAASELQARIRARFETALAAAPDEITRQRCVAALSDLDLAAISTLHAFANRLLSEFAVAAQLPPRVRVLDEVASQLAREQRWRNFVDGLYDDPANDRVVSRAALLGAPLESRYRNEATLKDVAMELTQSWDRLGPLLQERPPPIRPANFTAFDTAVDALRAELPRCTAPEDRLLRTLADVAMPELTRLRDLPDPERKLAAVKNAEWPRVGNLGRKGAWGGDVIAVRDAVAAVEAAASTVVEGAADNALRHLLILIAREVWSAAQARRGEGALEYHDLLVLVRELLREDAHVRGRLHDRYRHLLLDEFQDTDPLQIELATLIAAVVAGAAPQHWSALTVPEGRLFFVGDPKQSIYRFRRADIKLFLAARDRFGAGDNSVQLTTNFRTVRPVVNWVNDLFGHLMPTEIDGCQPKYEPLEAWREPSPSGDHRPVLLGGPHGDPKVKADDLRVAEAADVSAVIGDIRDRPDAWPVEDADGSWRPARLADVTVLVPTRTSLPFLRDALDARRLPYRLATGTLVYATQEVRDVLAVLAALDDPTDQLSLVASLRSALYACSDVDLYTFRQGGGRWDLRRDPPEDIPADHPVRLALHQLRALWQDRWWMGPSQLVSRVLSERSAFMLAFGATRPEDVWRRLRFLSDQARAFEEAGGRGVRAFLEWAELQGADSARVHEPLLPETDDDAVRILTIHGAKGLEFPITILSGMTTQPGGRRSGVSVLWDESGRAEIRLKSGLATANYEPRADLELEMDTHEKLRLLYVAATRARDHLVVSCHHKVDDNAARDTYASRVWKYAFERHRSRTVELGTPGKGDDTVVGAPAVVPDDRQEWIEARRLLWERLDQPTVVSATAVAQGAEDDHAVGRSRGRAGTAVGRAVHACLQVLDLASPHDVAEQAARQAQIEAVPELASTVESLVRSALASQAVRAAAVQNHHKEIYVAAPIEGRVVEGYVDLLVETPAGLLIVDYKTDGVYNDADVDAKLARYEVQAASYALALEHATSLEVTACRFVFCRVGEAIERDVGNLGAAKERAREVIRVDREEAPDLAYSHGDGPAHPQ